MALEGLASYKPVSYKKCEVYFEHRILYILQTNFPNFCMYDHKILTLYMFTVYLRGTMHALLVGPPTLGGFGTLEFTLVRPSVHAAVRVSVRFNFSQQPSISFF